MSQSRRASLAETIVGTVVGLVVALVTQRVVFPLYGIENTYRTDMQIVVIFTGVSIVRSYALRRAWNSRWWTRINWQVVAGTVDHVALGMTLAAAAALTYS